MLCSSYVTSVTEIAELYCVVTGCTLITGCLCVTVYDTVLLCVDLELNSYSESGFILIVVLCQLINLSYLRKLYWPY